MLPCPASGSDQTSSKQILHTTQGSKFEPQNWNVHTIALNFDLKHF